MSPRLERARMYRAKVGPTERVHSTRAIARAQDFLFLGSAGHAVHELLVFCNGLADAYLIAERPSAGLLAPLDGELAGAWADRCSAIVLSWYRQHFDAVAANDSSLDTRHRTPSRARA